MLTEYHRDVTRAATVIGAPDSDRHTYAKMTHVQAIKETDPSVIYVIRHTAP
jgi:hypothetical protein